LTQAEEGLANDETTNGYGASQDQSVLADDENGVAGAQAALGADQARQTAACAGRGASSAGCAQAGQKVAQDGQALSQADGQLAGAQLSAARDRSQAAAKVQSDDNQIQADQASVADLRASEAAPGGTYTWLPQVGRVVGEDQPLYALDGVKVPLLYGGLAAYRAFFVGMADGADVGQLARDLVGLGFGAGLAPSDHYSAATAAAVGRWQAALGLAVTGQVLLGQAVFEPGPLRVTTVTPTVGQSTGGAGGASASAASVLTATSTTPVVTVDLPVTQEYLVKPGDAVSVVLPDGASSVAGRVATVGQVAVCPGGTGTGTGSNTADQSPCGSSGSGNSSTPTVTVTVTLDRAPAGATLDQAPVNVNITTDRADHVLAVPVNALLALAGGGFGVEVVAGAASHLLAVTTGLYSSTLVQVSGAGLAAGMRVQVPSP
jgi:hypothetical protein